VRTATSSTAEETMSSDPSPPYQGVMMLKQSVGHAPYGWNESLWLNGPTFAASLSALEGLAERRLELLPKTVLLMALRVTNPLLPRASKFSQRDQCGHYASDRPAHFPWVSLLLRFNYAGYHTMYTLGGVPRDLADITGLHPTSTWQAAFDRFVEGIKQQCVLVNAKHLPKGTATNAAAPRETVVNPVGSVDILRVVARKRGLGHSYPPRARRARRKLDGG
jgi:hypothetical protein